MTALSQNGARRQRTISRVICGIEIETPINEDLRDIGRRAYERGGIDEMRDVFWQLTKKGINVGYSWDGIGQWYR